MQTPRLRYKERLITGPANLFITSLTALSGMPCSLDPFNSMLALARRRRYDCIPDQNLATWAIRLFISFSDQTINPFQFPVELIERLVKSMSDEDDWLLDPLLGMGATGITALCLGRHGAGAETTGQYVELARRRIEQEMAGTLRTRPNSQAR